MRCEEVKIIRLYFTKDELRKILNGSHEKLQRGFGGRSQFFYCGNLKVTISAYILGKVDFWDEKLTLHFDAFYEALKNNSFNKGGKVEIYCTG